MKGGMSCKRYEAELKMRWDEKTEDRFIDENNYEQPGGAVNEKHYLRQQVERWKRNLKKLREAEAKNAAAKEKDMVEETMLAKEESADNFDF